MTKVKRLYVISIDAMVGEDYEFMKTLPNIGPYVREASRVNKMRSVYPSLTYPCHASMVTGVYPEKHMVNHNELFIPGAEYLTWFNYHDVYPNIKTVLELAKENGYTAGSVFWPTTGGSNIDWNVNEIWSYVGGPAEDYEQMVKGSTKEFLDEVWPLMEPVYKHNHQPEFDYASNIALCEMIRRKKPEVLFQHVFYLDKIRHMKGVFAPEVYSDAWLHHDRLFGEVLDALRDIGELENTTIIITSDHGQTPVTHLVAPNLLFIRDGLIRVDGEGKLLDWDAFFFSAAHSCHVYIKDPSDKAFETRVLQLLNQYKENGEFGIERIFSKEEVEREYHVTGDFSFVIEPTDGVAFSNKLTGKLMRFADNSDYKYSVATHGHLPEKGPQPTFYLCGPNVKKGIIIEDARLIDQAPTIAALLGFEMEHVDGRVLKELV